MEKGSPLLEVDGLNVRFFTREGVVNAVRDVSFSLYPGEWLGIVGESGCGKSVTALSLTKLIPYPPAKMEARRLLFEGKDLLGASEKEMRRIRGNRISMVFQDPMTSLNPVLTIHRQLTEAIELHTGLKGKALEARCLELLRMVAISDPEMRLKSYPHQLSGGMRQRLMIAMAISCHPNLLVADEPTTALDVTIQDQILRLLRALAKELNTATILITHNLGAVAGTADRVMVMYAGRIVETAPVLDIFHKPMHPYTLGLLQSVPRIDREEGERLYSIQGMLPNPMHLLPGCSFAPRCAFQSGICIANPPSLEERESGHYVSCWRGN